MKLSVSLEDYLEAIYLIDAPEGVRVKDVAAALDVKAPSVTEAVQKLVVKKLVLAERYGKITLTDEGSQLAKKIYRKHKTLLTFFTDVLGVDKETSIRDACRMEHGLSEKTLSKLREFVDNQ